MIDYTELTCGSIVRVLVHPDGGFITTTIIALQPIPGNQYSSYPALIGWKSDCKFGFKYRSSSGQEELRNRIDHYRMFVKNWREYHFTYLAKPEEVVISQIIFQP